MFPSSIHSINTGKGALRQHSAAQVNHFDLVAASELTPLAMDRAEAARMRRTDDGRHSGFPENGDAAAAAASALPQAAFGASHRRSQRGRPPPPLRGAGEGVATKMKDAIVA